MDNITAYNTKTPFFYEVVFSAKESVVPFPNASTKQYFLETLKQAIVSLPLEILSYCILDKEVRLTIASYDQAPGSLENWLVTSGVAYSNIYYPQIFSNLGYLFKDKIYTKKLINVGAVADSIIYVNKLPIERGLAYTLEEYPFSSYLDYKQETAFCNLRAFYKFSGISSLEQFYAMISERIVKNLAFAPNIATYKRAIKNLLNKYGIKKRNYPVEVLPALFYEAIMETRANFSQLALTFKLNGDDFTFVLKKLGFMLAERRFTYQAIIEMIGVNTSEFLFDIIYEVNRQYKYSWKYIMNTLGLISVDERTYNSLLSYISNRDNLPIEAIDYQVRYGC